MLQGLVSARKHMDKIVQLVDIMSAGKISFLYEELFSFKKLIQAKLGTQSMYDF